MKASRGFTLIEMVVVLAVIAILAAVLTPIINSYVDRARINSANSDVKNIAASILQYNTDTKVWPIYKTNGDVPNGTGVYDVASTPGDTPSLGTGSTDWTTGILTGTTSLDVLLNTNFLGLPTTGPRAWKGAYLQIGTDPWGSAYFVTTANLKPDSTFAAYVISAGPNQSIETPYHPPKGATLTPGGDDIVQRIR
jgi:prepilin-type N-terminal cleavage/methylation domain-containing protein